MKCPKCQFINTHGATQCGDCGVVFADIRSGRGSSAPAIDLDCPFNDHGTICGKRGSMSDATNGAGPWYCSDHYWKLKGRPIKPDQTPQPSYRERWYTEHNLPYQPPRKIDSETLDKLKAWTATYGREPRMREPGED